MEKTLTMPATTNKGISRVLIFNFRIFTRTRAIAQKPRRIAVRWLVSKPMDVRIFPNTPIHPQNIPAIIIRNTDVFFTIYPPMARRCKKSVFTTPYLYNLCYFSIINI